MKGNVKKAMDPDNKAMLSKYLKMGIGSAVLAAGIGAVIRRNRANKDRNKAINASKNKNAIIIPVKEEDFLKDLPTPEAFAASRGGSEPVVESQAVAATELTPEEIAAKKKEILRSGSKFNFFRNKAAEDSKPEIKEEKSDVEKSDDKKPILNDEEPKSEGKESKEITLPPRNDLGQFVSPTDPTGVAKSEKDAEFDWTGSGKNLFFHPIKTIGGAWDSATSRPIYLAAGGIGSLFLASMIVDKVNEIRSKKAKGDADAARERYVKLLQGQEEKTAAESGYKDTENPFSAAGTLLGGSFIIPAALSAIIANKIMEKRKEDKAKSKEMSDSYPEEPIILYKTYMGKKAEITPETALALISIKRSMLKSAEEYDRMEKNAAVTVGDLKNGVKVLSAVMNPTGAALEYGAEKLKQYGPAIIKKVQDANKYAKYKPVLDIINNNWEEGKGLSDNGYELLQKPEYDGIVYDLSRMMANPDPNSKLPKEYEDKVNVLRRDPRTNDLLQGKFSNDKAIGYGQRWGKWQDEEIEKGVGEDFGNEGIGGLFKNIHSWPA